MYTILNITAILNCNTVFFKCLKYKIYRDIHPSKVYASLFIRNKMNYVN